MAVTLISSPAQLEDDLPTGLVVLVTDEPTAAAAAVVEHLGTAPPVSPEEAAAHLDVRDAATSGAGAAVGGDDALRMALEVARQEAADALARVPPAIRGTPPERLLAAAAAVRAAHQATVEARAVLGERPDLADDALEAALAAEEAATRARQRQAVDMGRCTRVLLAANAVGVLIVAARIRSPAVEPMFAIVAAGPFLALVYLVVTWITRARRSREAARLRSEALRATGLATMTGLAARQARVRAWAARADTLARAEASLARASLRWDALAAPAGPRDAATLVRAMAEAHRTAVAVADLEAGAAERQPDPCRRLVVLLDDAPDHPLDEQVRLLLKRLDEAETPAPVVLVTASSDVGSWAAARTGGPVHAEVVDLRGRVLAGLDRLRARAAGL